MPCAESTGRVHASEHSIHSQREAVQRACWESAASVALHVGRDPADVRQLRYLDADADDAGPGGASGGAGLRVTRHESEGHALGAGLKAQGVLQQTVLASLGLREAV